VIRTILLKSAVAAAALVATPLSAAVTLYGLTRTDSGRNLVSFSSETPGSFATNVEITGAVDRSVDLFSLDLNTSNNLLYSLGQNGGGQYSLFTIALDGTATKIGTGLGLNIASENVGLDYDFRSNMFRVVTNDDTTFWVDPATGRASVGDSFAYAANDPLGTPQPNVIAAAFNGQLYVLDKNGPGTSGILATLDGSTLTSVASLNTFLDTNASFDIAGNGEAYFHDGRVRDRLYQLDLRTGAAIDKGALQLQLTGLTAGPAAPGTPVPEPESWALMLTGFMLVGWGRRRQISQANGSAEKAA
jgi:hypothetical protein